MEKGSGPDDGSLRSDSDQSNLQQTGKFNKLNMRFFQSVDLACFCYPPIVPRFQRTLIRRNLLQIHILLRLPPRGPPAKPVGDRDPVADLAPSLNCRWNMIDCTFSW